VRNHPWKSVGRSRDPFTFWGHESYFWNG